MKLWLKAIWINLVELFWNVLDAALFMLAMAVLTALAFGVLGGAFWLIDHLFGPTGILVVALVVFGIVVIAMLAEVVRNIYVRVKNVKEGLEKAERSGQA